jgi:anti-sigma-K factor RskA/putative zinc finger protein
VTDDRTYGGLTCDEVRDLAGSFVLDALDPDEAAAVREHLATCPEAHEEIAELGGVVPVLAASVPVVEPPAGLKARVLAAAQADLDDRTRAATRPAAAPAEPAEPAGTSGAAEPIAFPGTGERERRRRRPVAAWVLGIAAVVAIALLGASTLVLRSELDQAQAYQQSVQAVIDVSTKPGSLTAVLTADGGTGTGLAAIDSAGTVTMAMQDLAPTAGGQVYEAWVIGGDGVPVPIGSFQVGNAGTGAMSASGVTATSGAVLALTLEAGPGATTPTLPIISKGVATGQA